MGVDLMDDLEKCVSRRLTNNSSTNVTGKNLNQTCACVYGDVRSGGIFERSRIKTIFLQVGFIQNFTFCAHVTCPLRT